MRAIPLLLALAAFALPAPFAATAAARPASPQGRWLVEDIRHRGVIDNLQTTLEIDAAGKVSGLGGCNGYGGAARIKGNRIAFTPMAATRMACLPAVMDQEDKFHKALARVVRWRILPTGQLLLFDRSGRAVLKLARLGAPGSQ